MHMFSRGVGLLVGLLWSGLALGHVPYFERIDFREARPFAVPKSVEQSIAVYAWLRSTRDLDFYAFQLDGGQPTRVFLEVLVPVCPGYENLLPWFAVVGPGLPAPEPGTTLPFEVPPGEGVVVMPNLAPGEPRDTFYEPFGGKSYYQGPRFDQFLSGPGAYKVVYWDPRGAIGDYVAIIGADEIWEADDIARAVRLTPVIRQNGELHTECPS